MHWINFPVLFTMMWSGLLIYWNDSDNAYLYPHRVYRIGIGNFTLFRFFPDWFYNKLHVPYHVTQGLGYHFFFMWFFALNGIAWVLYTWLSGEWRFPPPPAPQPPRRHPGHPCRSSLPQRPSPPDQVQRSPAHRLHLLHRHGRGHADHRPSHLQTHLRPLAHHPCGGYEMARWLHFWITMAFLGFFFVHVGQVILAGWNNFRAMVSGLEVQHIDAPSLEAERRRK